MIDASMIEIRHAQIDALAPAFMARFMTRARAHVATHFPELHERLGDGVEQEIRHAAERATSHGLAEDSEALQYLTLMLMFGRDFDRDRPWAQEVLQGSAPSGLRLAHLEAQALLHEDETVDYVEALRD